MTRLLRQKLEESLRRHLRKLRKANLSPVPRLLENDCADKHVDATPRRQLRLRSISDVASHFAALNSHDSEAMATKTATNVLLEGKQGNFRKLCSTKWEAGGEKQKDWGAQRRDKLGSNKRDADIHKELKRNVLVAARKYLSSIGAAEHASNLANADPQHSSGNQDATHQRSSGSNQDVAPQPGNANGGDAEHVKMRSAPTPAHRNERRSTERAVAQHRRTGTLHRALRLVLQSMVPIAP